MKNGSKKRRAWTADQVRELRSLARKKTPVGMKPRPGARRSSPCSGSALAPDAWSAAAAGGVDVYRCATACTARAAAPHATGRTATDRSSRARPAWQDHPRRSHAATARSAAATTCAQVSPQRPRANASRARTSTASDDAHAPTSPSQHAARGKRLRPPLRLTSLATVVCGRPIARAIALKLSPHAKPRETSSRSPNHRHLPGALARRRSHPPRPSNTRSHIVPRHPHLARDRVQRVPLDPQLPHPLSPPLRPPSHHHHLSLGRQPTRPTGRSDGAPTP